MDHLSKTCLVVIVAFLGVITFELSFSSQRVEAARSLQYMVFDTTAKSFTDDTNKAVVQAWDIFTVMTESPL